MIRARHIFAVYARTFRSELTCSDRWIPLTEASVQIPGRFNYRTKCHSTQVEVQSHYTILDNEEGFRCHRRIQAASEQHQGRFTLYVLGPSTHYCLYWLSVPFKVLVTTDSRLAISEMRDTLSTTVTRATETAQSHITSTVKSQAHCIRGEIHSLGDIQREHAAQIFEKLQDIIKDRYVWSSSSMSISYL